MIEARRSLKFEFQWFISQQKEPNIGQRRLPTSLMFTRENHEVCRLFPQSSWATSHLSVMQEQRPHQV
jgi:hypothetical protein